VAVDQLLATARAEGLSLSATTTGFEAHEPAVERYGAVLLFGLLQILTREQIEALKARLDTWTVPGSLLFVTSFTKSDPGYQAPEQAQHAAAGEGEGGGAGRGVPSRRRQKKSVVLTHLERGELPALFPGWSVVFFEEGWGPEHNHGDGELHRHHLAQAVLTRRACPSAR
jgi:hypothetical protein